MNSILLNPTDVLFFRDGRPMGGSSSGHGAAWPAPNVVSAAFHAALHRAGFQDVHRHRPILKGQVASEDRDNDGRLFGSLTTAGPFPVCSNGLAHTWFFPRPADAVPLGLASEVVFLPIAESGSGRGSSPTPLRYTVGSGNAPTKNLPEPWWSEGAWNAYLGSSQRDELAKRPFFKSDSAFSDHEHTYGIGINPETGSVKDGAFYSASYLRLRDGWRLGVFASAVDKQYQHPQHGNDLVAGLLDGGQGQIMVGGQQRVCSVSASGERLGGRLPLPLGLSDAGAFTRLSNGKWAVKWILLSPAIWQEIAPEKRDGSRQNPHPGGWLPTWIDPVDGSVLLRAGSTERNPNESRERWRNRVRDLSSIPAKLAAAMVGKASVITGWATGTSSARPEEGAKSTLLAVPAGAVYYFEAETAADAAALANALNWHGSTVGTAIRNRRSTLMGEKGFGLGVCGTWAFHSANPVS